MSATDIVKGLLSKAFEDLKAAEILNREGLKSLALNHLEQASEKILKAYFIGYLIDFLRFVYEIAERANASKVYRGIHQLVKQAVKQYAVPKHLGHDFDAFLSKFLPELYDGFCGGVFARYVKYSIDYGLIPYINKRREAILAKLVNEGLSTEQAERLLNAVIKLVSQVPGSIEDEEMRQRLCQSENIKEFVHGLRKVRESEKPCLDATVKLYKFVDEAVKRYCEEEATRKREVVQSIERVKRVLKELAEYTGLKLLEEYGGKLDALVLNLVRGNMLVFMTLPLHMCLVKYYEPTRYPEGRVPEEEYEAIPSVLEMLREVYGIVANLVELQARHP